MKIAKLAIVLLILTVNVGCDNPAYAGETIKPRSIIKVYDGDTFTIRLPEHTLQQDTRANIRH